MYKFIIALVVCVVNISIGAAAQKIPSFSGDSESSNFNNNTEYNPFLQPVQQSQSLPVKVNVLTMRISDYKQVTIQKEQGNDFDFMQWYQTLKNPVDLVYTAKHGADLESMQESMFVAPYSLTISFQEDTVQAQSNLCTVSKQFSNFRCILCCTRSVLGELYQSHHTALFQIQRREQLLNLLRQASQLALLAQFYRNTFNS